MRGEFTLRPPQAPTDTAALRELMKRVAGPYTFRVSDEHGSAYVGNGSGIESLHVSKPLFSSSQPSPLAELTAAALNALPALLDEVEAARAAAVAPQIAAQADEVSGEVWAWLNRHDAPWSPSDAKVNDLAFAVVKRLTEQQGSDA